MNPELAKTKQKQSMNPSKETLTDKARVYASVVIDPIVTFLASYHISPDFLTLLGTVGHFPVAWLVIQGQMSWAGLLLLLIAPLDALDGALARKIGRQPGGFGAFWDSTLDRLAEIILFGGFLYYYLQQGNVPMMVISYLAITGSMMVSYARGRAEGLGFVGKIGLFGRLERYVALVVLLLLNLPELCLILLAIATYITVGQRIYHVWKQSQVEKE